MAFDGLFCAAVAQELNKWAGARVEKIHQSSQTCFYFQIYRDGKRGNFVISASASRPILAITEESVARPDTPTPTCMLYRKHLQNGRFIEAAWVENERIIRFVFDSADEMGYIKRKFIYAEMMGKYSNIILTDDKNRILSASSTSDITAGVRSIMAGLTYEQPPKQDKISIFSVDDASFLSLCEEKCGISMSKYFRFPEGKYSEQALKFVQKTGYKTIFWSFAYDDWDNNRQPNPKSSITKILSNTHNGAVMLFHPTSKTNADIFQSLITEWKKAGYRFGTLDELTS
jgi:predicted ribosome quality control (RQC) complex YloA/Tae2 family protein